MAGRDCAGGGACRAGQLLLPVWRRYAAGGAAAAYLAAAGFLEGAMEGRAVRAAERGGKFAGWAASGRGRVGHRRTERMPASGIGNGRRVPGGGALRRGGGPNRRGRSALFDGLSGVHLRQRAVVRGRIFRRNSERTMAGAAGGRFKVAG